MNKEHYLSEIKKQYHLICVGLKSGRKISASEKGRFEGFMQAGLLLGVVTKDELQQLLESVHFKMFAKSIAERRKDQKGGRLEDEIDYGQFDNPAIGRVTRK